MSICITLLPLGTVMGEDPKKGAEVQSSYGYLIADTSCAAGLKVYTQTEIDQLKQTLTVDTSSNPERVLDMQAVFYGFLLVLVTVWGLKQLLNLFTGDTDRG